MKTVIQNTTTKKIRISIHPKLAAVLDVLIGIGLVWIFNHTLTSWWMMIVWVLARVVWWIILMRGVYYAQAIRRTDHLRSLLAFQIGVSITILFIDWTLNRYIWGALLVLAPALSFWLLPTHASDLSFVAKPLTRWCLMLTVIGIAGVWSGAAAITVFYSFWYWIIVWIAATLWTMVLSVVWWREYDAPRDRQLLLWILGVGSILLEISAVLLLWPIGFLIIGVLITWLWYLLWQLGRFYFSTEGIEWRKQLRFLISNVVLIIIVIVGIARWK